MTESKKRNPYQASASDRSKTKSNRVRLTTMELVVSSVIVSSLFILIMPAAGKGTFQVGSGSPFFGILEVLDDERMQLGAKTALVTMGIFFVTGCIKAFIQNFYGFDK